MSESEREKFRNLIQQTSEAINARDELLSMISHELKTPLTSLRLQAQITRRGIDRNDPEAFSEERMRMLVNQTDRQIERLVRLVDDMLDVSRISAGKLAVNPERVDLRLMIIDVVERLHLLLSEAGCRLSLDLPENVCGFYDCFRLEQVLTNLLSNAAKYAAGTPVGITLRVNGSEAEIRVKDHGRGIDPRDHDRVFERFERAVSLSESSGLGLGLFISRQIVELHSGRIWVESRLGEGATFVVSLPL